METMTCTRCGETKPLEDFIKNPVISNGRQNPCKTCKNLYRNAGLSGNTPIDVVKSEYERILNERQQKINDFVKSRSDEMTCTKCGKTKPLEEFRKLKSARNGRMQPCRACENIRKRATYPRYQKNNNERAKKENKKIRLTILTAYGNKCACCGESEPKFLALDHIHNDGAKHRKELGGTNRVYYWAIRNNFPKDVLQLLCHNCNLAKGFYGVCPHQEKLTE
jgi:hypothetical protein